MQRFFSAVAPGGCCKDFLKDKNKNEVRTESDAESSTKLRFGPACLVVATFANSECVVYLCCFGALLAAYQTLVFDWEA